jgi:hypothetical protein
LIYSLFIFRDVKTSTDKEEFIAYCRQELFPVDARNVDLQESFMQVVKETKSETSKSRVSSTPTRNVKVDTRQTVPCGSHCAIPNIHFKDRYVEGDGYQGVLIVLWALSQALGVSRVCFEAEILALGKIFEKSAGIGDIEDKLSESENE